MFNGRTDVCVVDFSDLWRSGDNGSMHYGTWVTWFKEGSNCADLVRGNSGG
jgi:hypothetical protein